jgi:hypothetical protein
LTVKPNFTAALVRPLAVARTWNVCLPGFSFL